jgi:hypothetical protein
MEPSMGWLVHPTKKKIAEKIDPKKVNRLVFMLRFSRQEMVSPRR